MTNDVHIDICFVLSTLFTTDQISHIFIVLLKITFTTVILKCY